MLEQKVHLDFTCSSCEHTINVTLMCRGSGLEGCPNATVFVPCPTCGAVSKVMFEPNGKVKNVTPHGGPLRFLEPSLN